MRFLSFVILAQEMGIEVEKIKAIKSWPKLKSVRDILIFLGFANFYKRFIRNLDRIPVSLILIL